MSNKSTNKEKETAIHYFNYENMTDEEVDAIIIPVIEDCKAKRQKKGKIRWTEPLLLLRNSVVFDLMYKKGYSKRKTIDTLMARWQIAEQKAYDYINIANAELKKTYEDDIDTIRNQQLEKLQQLYDDAVLHNEKKVALSAMDQINKIQGIYDEHKTVTLENITFEFD